MTVNYATAAVMAYGIFEELEAAYRMGQIDEGSEKTEATAGAGA